MWDATRWGMATMQSPYVLHDHAGARWLAPFLTVLILAMLGLAVLLTYPHLGLAGQI